YGSCEWQDTFGVLRKSVRIPPGSRHGFDSGRDGGSRSSSVNDFRCRRFLFHSFFARLVRCKLLRFAQEKILMQQHDVALRPRALSLLVALLTVAMTLPALAAP